MQISTQFLTGFRLISLCMALAAISFVSGCLEPQPAPELALRLSTDFSLKIMADNLSSPWSVAELPDGSYLITERGGQLLYVKGSERTYLDGLPGDIFVGGQAGLFDVVLVPDFETTKEVYISYAYGDYDANGTALLRTKLNLAPKGAFLEDPQVIFKAGPPKEGTSHFGGRIAFLPEGELILTLGEGFAYREGAQEPDTHLGKIVRLTRAGDVPPDNPYLGKSGESGASFKPEIYSMGHRNPQGATYDAERDVLWVHEHGPRGGDELNIIKPGKNYGWPIATKGLDYQGAKISPYESFVGMEDPVRSWVPSIAPSGLAIYRGDMFEGWDGDALIGGLASRDLRRVDLEQTPDGVRAVGETELLSDLDGRVRDVRLARDGAVLVLIEGPDVGRLLRLTPP